MSMRSLSCAIAILALVACRSPSSRHDPPSSPTDAAQPAPPALDDRTACRDVAATIARVGAALDRHAPVLAGDLVVLSACAPRSAARRRLHQAIADGSYVERPRGSWCEASMYFAEGDPQPSTAERARFGDDKLANDLYVSRDAKPHGRCAAAVGSSGLMSLFACHAFVKGHGDISDEVARALQFTNDGVALIADAAQDADYYEWTKPAAHAQTDCDSAGMLVHRDTAQASFLGWERAQVGHLVDACKAGNTREALYWFGYGMHGLQDLVFHEGISNAEHSFRDHHHGAGIDCHDQLDRKLRQAAMATRIYAEHVRQRIGACWESMRLWSAPDGAPSVELGPADKSRLHHGTWDLDLVGYGKIGDVVADRDRASNGAYAPTIELSADELWIRRGDETLLRRFADSPQIWK